MIDNAILCGVNNNAVIPVRVDATGNLSQTVGNSTNNNYRQAADMQAVLLGVYNGQPVALLVNANGELQL